MRQVNEAELIVSIRFQLSRLPASLRQQLASRERDKQRQAEQMLAERIIRSALDRYEILSSAPLPSNTDLFSASAYGHTAGSAPTIVDN